MTSWVRDRPEDWACCSSRLRTSFGTFKFNGISLLFGFCASLGISSSIRFSIVLRVRIRKILASSILFGYVLVRTLERILEGGTIAQRWEEIRN